MLIHIGYHKTASTWLQKIIFQEDYGFYQPVSMSELYSNVVKPTDFTFNAVQVASKFNGMLRSYGLAPVLSHERFCGDPFTGSRDTKALADRIYALYPEAKVLILVRNQVDLITALYRTYVIQGGKANIEDFLNPPENEVNQWFNKECYMFHIAIEYYISLFGRNNVMVVPFEVLKKNNEDFYCKLASFAGVAPSFSSSDKKVNVGLCDTSIGIQCWINKIFTPFSVYGLDLANNKIWRLFRSLVFRLNPMIKKIFNHKPIRNQVQKHCEGTYENSNSLLQGYISDDLSSLNYACCKRGNKL